MSTFKMPPNHFKMLDGSFFAKLRMVKINNNKQDKVIAQINAG